MATQKLCAEDGCGKRVVSRGLCMQHYMRVWRSGGIEPTRHPKTPRGEVQRFITQTAIPWASDDCLTWPFTKTPDGRGYARFRGRWGLASRHICEAVYGPPPTPRHEAAHSCGRGHDGCVNPRHLRWATHVENEADKIVHGTSQHGERNRQAKLSREQVDEVRALAGAQSQRQIAERYGITQSAVSMIQRGLRWTEEAP